MTEEEGQCVCVCVCVCVFVCVFVCVGGGGVRLGGLGKADMQECQVMRCSRVSARALPFVFRDICECTISFQIIKKH